MEKGVDYRRLLTKFVELTGYTPCCVDFCAWAARAGWSQEEIEALIALLDEGAHGSRDWS